MGSSGLGVDLRWVAIAKRSAQYRQIRSRVARLCPADAWYEDSLAFIVFDLLPAGEGTQAVFVVDGDVGALLAASVVSRPDAAGDVSVVRLPGDDRLEEEG